MRVYREDHLYKLQKQDIVISESAIQLNMCDRRKELLYEWASKQIDSINEKKLHHPCGAFFTYQITPSGIGSDIVVVCHATQEVLDLSLIDDEEW